MDSGYIDVAKGNMQMISLTEEDARYRLRWRQRLR